ncbi:hypothetical protein N7G274_010323 [Stereocaulon virgatum]|uniref:Uncharacterized protein n=1 Tax=Stereocaulon virgatum TaxID=373712 RepID=A0ABR3ZTQ3_9LECA
MLSTLDNLRALTWVYWSTDPDPEDLVDMADFRNSRAFEDIRHRWPNLRYSVDGLKAKYIRTWFFSDIPVPVISCKLIEWRHWYYGKFDRSLKNSILLDTALETLSISGADRHATIRETDIDQCDQMPPIKELSLHQFEWDYSVVAATTFWNWSNVSRLELKEVPLKSFLQTVAPSYLVHLKEFTTDGHYRHRSEREEITNLISILVLGIRALQKLILTCYVGNDKIVAAVSKHGDTLHTLQLCVYHTIRQRPMSDKPGHWPLNERQVESIGRACPHLTTLVLDYVPNGITLPGWTRHGDNSIGGRRIPALPGRDSALNEFRNLRRLTAYAWVCQWEPPPLITYSEIGNAWLHRFVVAKKGAPFESVELEVNVFGIFPNKIHLCIGIQKVNYRAD